MASEEGAKPKLKVGGELRFAFDTDDVSLHVAHTVRAPMRSTFQRSIALQRND